jgi:hypothetical protein
LRVLGKETRKITRARAGDVGKPLRGPGCGGIAHNRVLHTVHRWMDMVTVAHPRREGRVRS